MVIAGEESGEIYGARLMREIKKLAPTATFSGVGGDRMAAEGFNILYHCRDMASIGVVQMLEKLSFFLGALKDIRARVSSGEFDAVILIDYPDFNLQVAKTAYRAGVPVFYYVCPQFWVWRRYRIKSVQKWVDTMLVILPFEEEFYRERGVDARFIGHPMLDEISPPRDRSALRSRFMAGSAGTLIGLLPGSRTSEVNAMLEPMLGTADAIHDEKPDTSFVIPVAPHIPRNEIEQAIGGRPYVKAVSGNSHDVMAASVLLITKSGTSTLEAAIVGTPMIIIYRLPFFSYWLARLLAHVKYVGLPNLIADREVAREFLQRDVKPAAVARAALELLNDPEKMERARKDMRDIRTKLGDSGAPRRAAGVILDRLKTVKETGGAD